MSKSIKLKNDIYIDSSGIAYNHTKLDDKLYAINEQFRHGYKGIQEYFSGSVDVFKTKIITDDYPIGCYFLHLNFNGSVSCAIVEKANNNYLSFILFSYGIVAKQYRYLAGTWYENNL